MIKPSERIKQILTKKHPNSYFSSAYDWIGAILDYLDEQAEEESIRRAGIVNGEWNSPAPNKVDRWKQPEKKDELEKELEVLIKLNK